MKIIFSSYQITYLKNFGEKDDFYISQQYLSKQQKYYVFTEKFNLLNFYYRRIFISKILFDKYTDNNKGNTYNNEFYNYFALYHV